ncbi:MAG TPA: DUF1573 domain-containing protein [Verrucomicrobiae bacterium]|nr:DUF1573 domain-containing protein [Verrucomicrobiae bacterium]
MRTIIKSTVLGLLLAGLQAALAVPHDPPLAPTPATPAPQIPGTNHTAAKIQFASSIHDFGRAKAGELVKYTYIFTNVGTGVLEISHVQPSCGCTTAGQWTRKVLPGGTGEIPIQMASDHFNGPVFKTISVASNDKSQPTVVLQLKGTIWRPIEISPPYPMLNVSPDEPTASTTARITNNMAEPLIVMDPESNNRSFRAELRTNEFGRQYEVTITAVPPLGPGNVSGKITLKTTSASTPTIDVLFWANVRPPLNLYPSQLTLNAPSSNPTNARLTIQNNSTNALTLSDPTVNAPGAPVQVQVQEMQPGRLYAVQLTFPAGFEIPPGQHVAFTAKSNNPHVPLIQVPIFQAGRAPQLAPSRFLGRPPMPNPPTAIAPTAKAVQ